MSESVGVGDLGRHLSGKVLWAPRHPNETSSRTGTQATSCTRFLLARYAEEVDDRVIE